MIKGVYVIGTNTDVGKTFVSGLILKALREEKINAIYYKAVLSGAKREGEKLIPLDCREVIKISGLCEREENMVSYILEHPYSPHLAKEVEKVYISFNKIKEDYKKLKEKYEFIVCEGSGGIVCPISLKGSHKIMLEDIVEEFNLPIILVSNSSLGAINSTVLTVNYLKNIGLSVHCIVLNNFCENNIIHRDNKKTIKLLTKVERIVTLPKIDNLNNIEEGLLRSVREAVYDK